MPSPKNSSDPNGDTSSIPPRRVGFFSSAFGNDPETLARQHEHFRRRMASPQREDKRAAVKNPYFAKLQPWISGERKAGWAIFIALLGALAYVAYIAIKP